MRSAVLALVLVGAIGTVGLHLAAAQGKKDKEQAKRVPCPKEMSGALRTANVAVR